MTNKFLNLLLLCSTALLASAPTLASGSGGGGGGSYGNYPVTSEPRDPFADAYSRGKSQFKKRIICKTCAYPRGVNDSVTAGKVAKRISAGEFQLSENQRSDLMIFLQRRYGVTA
jgi:hypothetical protein